MSLSMRDYQTNEDKDIYQVCKTRKQKLVHLLATALTLALTLALTATLPLNHLAKKLLWMTSTLCSLMTNGSTMDYEYVNWHVTGYSVA